MRVKASILFANLLGLMAAQSSFAMSVQELKKKLEQKEELTIIDVRENALYQQSHIPNAINIPASLVEAKKLPRLGTVVVYGDGIVDEGVHESVAFLNSKPGINAELLVGGYSGWTSDNVVVHRNRGLISDSVNNIPYATLVSMAGKGKSIILVDLRSGENRASLSDHFSNTRIITPESSPSDDTSITQLSGQIMAELPRNERSVLVLIDDGNGISEMLANKLHAAGVRRIAVLVGGEKAIQVKGKSSVQVHKPEG